MASVIQILAALCLFWNVFIMAKGIKRSRLDEQPSCHMPNFPEMKEVEKEPKRQKIEREEEEEDPLYYLQALCDDSLLAHFESHTYASVVVEFPEAPHPVVSYQDFLPSPLVFENADLARQALDKARAEAAGKLFTPLKERMSDIEKELSSRLPDSGVTQWKSLWTSSKVFLPDISLTQLLFLRFDSFSIQPIRFFLNFPLKSASDNGIGLSTLEDTCPGHLRPFRLRKKDLSTISSLFEYPDQILCRSGTFLTDEVVSTWPVSQGESTTVGVIDDPIDQHDAYIRDSMVPGGLRRFGNKPEQDDRHGTDVTQNILGRKDHIRLGVAPRASWIGAEVECYSQTAQAMQWFLNAFSLEPVEANRFETKEKAPKMIDVLNLSLGPQERFQQCDFFEGEMKLFEKMNVIVVVSIGNEGPACGSIDTPFHPWPFYIGAVSGEGNLRSYSSRAYHTRAYLDACRKLANNFDCQKVRKQPDHDQMEFHRCFPRAPVDFVCPGSEVITMQMDEGDELFDVNSGTSFATAWFSGAVALLRSILPSLTRAEIDGIFRSNSLPTYVDILNIADSCRLSWHKKLYGTRRRLKNSPAFSVLLEEEKLLDTVREGKPFQHFVGEGYPSLARSVRVASIMAAIHVKDHKVYYEEEFHDVFEKNLKVDQFNLFSVSSQKFFLNTLMAHFHSRTKVEPKELVYFKGLYRLLVESSNEFSNTLCSIGSDYLKGIKIEPHPRRLYLALMSPQNTVKEKMEILWNKDEAIARSFLRNAFRLADIHDNDMNIMEKSWAHFWLYLFYPLLPKLMPLVSHEVRVAFLLSRYSEVEEIEKEYFNNLLDSLTIEDVMALFQDMRMKNAADQCLARVFQSSLLSSSNKPKEMFESLSHKTDWAEAVLRGSVR